MAHENPMPADPAGILPATFLSRTALLERGIRRRQITHLVSTQQLIRLRNGRYALPGMRPELIQAGRLGARLDCVSLLKALGVFVHTLDALHVQVEKGATRLPLPGKDVVRHWRRSSCARDRLAADIVEALAQSFRCQAPREAIATIDSACYLGLVDEEQVDAVFTLLPRRFQGLRRLIDPRAESGPETIMRLMLRGLGCHIEVQVSIPGVGRVDFVVDGWLIIECDSKQYHEGWDGQKRDRRRDMAAAALGYSTIRPIAEDILYRREQVLAMLREVIAHRPPQFGVQNSSDPARRVRKPAINRPACTESTEF